MAKSFIDPGLFIARADPERIDRWLKKHNAFYNHYQDMHASLVDKGWEFEDWSESYTLGGIESLDEAANFTLGANYADIWGEGFIPNGSGFFDLAPWQIFDAFKIGGLWHMELWQLAVGGLNPFEDLFPFQLGCGIVIRIINQMWQLKAAHVLNSVYRVDPRILGA